MSHLFPRRLPWVALLAMLVALVISGAAAGKAPIIADVIADPSVTSITISGVNFGGNAPTVQIGNFVLPLGISSHTDTAVLATLPADIVPGSYLLTLTVPGKGGGR